MIINGREIKGKLSESADVCIVGSGSGGSVLARELSGHGLSTILLEEGNYYTAAQFNQREDDMLSRLFREKGRQRTDDMTITVLQGRCVGGSPVVNMADCVQASDGVLKHWEKFYNVKGLEHGEFLSILKNRIGKDLNINKIQESQINRNNLMLKKGAEKLGYSGATFLNNRVGCIGCGYCTLGCAYDAKKSTLITYIPEALNNGTKLIYNCRADRVLIKNNSVQGVRATALPSGAEVNIYAKIVILSCGAIHTPRLLLNSELIRNRFLFGANLSLQPQMAVVAVFKEDITGFRGIPQSYYCDEFERATPEEGLTGFRLEGIFSGPGMSAMFLPSFGIEHKNLMHLYPNIAGLLILVPDKPSGKVTYTKNGRPVISYTLSETIKKTLKKGILEATRIYFEAGAEKVLIPVDGTPQFKSPSEVQKTLEKMDFTAGGYRLVSAHPQGTCRMGSDPLTSVVDTNCESHELKGLFVCDSSIFPTTASSHIMLPIMTMAYRTADYIKENAVKYM